MGNYCCNKSRLLEFLKRETNEKNPLTRAKIESKMGAYKLERKTFSKYVCESRDDLGPAYTDNTVGYIETINKGPETVYYYQPGIDELTEDETHIIIDSIISLKCLPPELKTAISKKLLLQTNKYVKDRFLSTALEQDLTIDKKKPVIDVSILNMVINAVRSKRSLLFDYYKYTFLKERIIKEINELEYAQPPKIVFASDQWEINKAIREEKEDISLLVGSTNEKEVALEKGIQYLNATFPMNERLVFNRTYSGYKGSLTFTEDLYDNL